MGTLGQGEIRAPIGSDDSEKNVAVDDFVTTELDMFKIADLARLSEVQAHL